MGILNWLGVKSEPPASLSAGWSWDYFEKNLSSLFPHLSQSPAEMYDSQPELRTVIDFIGEQAAQTGLHVFTRQADGGSVRLRNDPVANVLNRPTEHTTSFEFIESLVKDYALNDNAFVFVEPTTDSEYPFKLHNILASWVTGTGGGDAYAPEYYIVQPPGASKSVHLPISQVIALHGWSPTKVRNGSPKVNALREILKEQAYAYGSRVAMWENGGQSGTVISRPVDAPDWTLEEDKKFMRYMANRKPGQTLVLKDGMEAAQMRFSAHDEDFVEASKLAFNRVAVIYGVNPVMVGQTEDANYSNAKIFREMLYGETLGPYFKRIVTKLNSRLLPMIKAPKNVFVEFNVKEKLKASFEEQAAAMVSAGGGPWKTRNELRAMENLPAIEGQGMDEVIFPLNSIAGSQIAAAAATQSAPKKALTGLSMKALTTGNTGEDVVLATLDLFLKRQASSVLGKLASKGVDDEGWWSAERWDKELDEELSKAAELVAQIGTGGSVEGYNSKAHASMINSLTRQQLINAVKAGDSASAVFTEARGARVSEAASALIEAVLG